MDAYIGQIMMWPGKRIPRDWNLCDGSLLKISDYQPLYALIGTRYGGDGVNTFGVPDLRGRVPVGQGQGTGLSNRIAGESGGQETVTLTQANLPLHTHAIRATSATGTESSPANHVWATYTGFKLYSTLAKDETLAPQVLTSVGNTGAVASHDNVMPSLAINYIICLNGLFPIKN